MRLTLSGVTAGLLKQIFGVSDNLPPLEQKLLQAIQRELGISRKGLHKAMGNNITADTLVKALGVLVENEWLTARWKAAAVARPNAGIQARRQSRSRRLRTNELSRLSKGR